MGARLLTGRHRLPRPGNFYAPTVLVGVPENAPAYRDRVIRTVAVMFAPAQITGHKSA